MAMILLCVSVRPNELDGGAPSLLWPVDSVLSHPVKDIRHNDIILFNYILLYRYEQWQEKMRYTESQGG